MPRCKRGQRMFHVVDGVAGDEYKVEVGRIRQQLAVVVIEGAAKALLFFRGGCPRVGHGDAANRRVLHRLKALHVVTPAPAEADESEPQVRCRARY